jgi:hypothetical protein
VDLWMQQVGHNPILTKENHVPERQGAKKQCKEVMQRNCKMRQFRYREQYSQVHKTLQRAVKGNELFTVPCRNPDQLVGKGGGSFSLSILPGHPRETEPNWAADSPVDGESRSSQ